MLYVSTTDPKGHSIDRILFPGKSSFPLSPCNKNREKDSPNVISKHDQMKLIMKFIGVPEDQDLSFLTDKPAISYLQEVSQGCTAVDLLAKFSHCKKRDLIKLLKQLLMFNPFYRCSASEALKNEIFDSIRDSKKEKSCHTKITLEIDSDEAFDYEKGSSPIFKLKDYQKIIEKEA